MNIREMTLVQSMYAFLCHFYYMCRHIMKIQSHSATAEISLIISAIVEISTPQRFVLKTWLLACDTTRKTSGRKRGHWGTLRTWVPLFPFQAPTRGTALVYRVPGMTHEYFLLLIPASSQAPEATGLTEHH